MSYIVVGGSCCDIIVSNVRAPRKEKSDHSKESFYEELEQVFNHFPKYHTKILFGEFNAKLGQEDIFKPRIGNNSLHHDSNNNGARIVNLPHQKSSC